MADLIPFSEKCPHCQKTVIRGEKHECCGPCPDVPEEKSTVFYPCAQSGFVGTPTDGEKKPKAEKRGEG